MDNLVDSLVGRRVGNYIVSSLLQEGGMGTVYLAEHPEIGRRVAIKVLPRTQGDMPGVAERFIVEARAIARIDHPNVIDIYDFGRTADGQLYYIMELLKGRELGELMSEKGPMSPGEVMPLLQQICAGLQAAHETGVVHRDLKPENIFLDERGDRTVKILDFGIAKLLEDSGGQGLAVTQAGMVMGTPYTIAPEQAAGRPDQIGPHTDIYSLGAILYWMLAGYPPFMAEPTAVILAQHIKDAPLPLAEVDSTLPTRVVAVVESCLSKLPSERPASADLVAQTFERAVRATRTFVGGAGGDASHGSSTGPIAVDVSDTVADVALPAALRAAAAANSARANSPATPRQRTRDTLLGAHLAAWRWPLIGSLVVALLLGTVLALSGGGPADRPDGVAVAEPRPGRPASRPPAGTAAPAPAAAAVPARMEQQPARSPDEHFPGGPTLHDGVVEPAIPEAPLLQHEIEIVSDVAQASCLFNLEGVELPVIPVPCRIQVRAGQRLRVGVLAQGYQRYERDWTVQRDETLTVKLVRLPGDDQRVRTPVRNARKRVRRKRSRPPTSRSVPASKPAAPQQLGSGTMDF